MDNCPSGTATGAKQMPLEALTCRPAVDHPGGRVSVCHYAESLSPEGLFKWHVDGAAFCKGVEIALGVASSSSCIDMPKPALTAPPVLGGESAPMSSWSPTIRWALIILSCQSLETCSPAGLSPWVIIATISPPNTLPQNSNASLQLPAKRRYDTNFISPV